MKSAYTHYLFIWCHLLSLSQEFITSRYYDLKNMHTDFQHFKLPLLIPSINQSIHFDNIANKPWLIFHRDLNAVYFDCNEVIIFCDSKTLCVELICNQWWGETSPSAANDFTKISTPSSLSRARRSACLNSTTRGLPLTSQTSKHTSVCLHLFVCACA